MAVHGRTGNVRWGRLAQTTAQLAQALHQAGLRPGQLLGLCCADRTLVLPILIAIEALGAIHSLLAPEELTATDPVASRCDMLLGPQVVPLYAGQTVLRLSESWLGRTLARPATDAAMALLATPSPPETPVRIGRTSGTTGAPKVMLNRRGLLHELHLVADHAYRPIGPEHIYVSVYPANMRGIYVDLMRAVLEGNRIVLAEQAEDFAQLERPELCRTWLMARAAALLTEALDASGHRLGLHYVGVMGGHVSPALDAAMRRALSSKIVNVYSSNEAHVIAVTPPDEPGIIMPRVEVRIVDDALRTVPEGEVGQIAVRGPRVVEGYLWDPDQTARQFRDGWFLTSDLGRIPVPGRLEILGRADDMLNIGGRKVPPQPIEEQLKALPGVRDAVLLAHEDALGVGLLLVVVERADPAGDAALTAQVRTVLQPHCASFQLHFRSRLPRTETGKPRRAELARELAAGG